MSIANIKNMVTVTYKITEVKKQHVTVTDKI